MRKYWYSLTALYILAVFLALTLFFFEKGSVLAVSIADIPVFVLAFLHTLAGLRIFYWKKKKHAVADAFEMATAMRKRKTGLDKRRQGPRDEFFLYEVLFALSLVTFLFSYIFARAANMDYVQRFIATGGNLNLALDTGAERIAVLLRYGVYLLVYPFVLWIRVLAVRDEKARKGWSPYLESCFHIILLLVSALMHALSFPSFLSANGVGILAWVSLVPLFLILRKSRPSRFFFYGLFWMSISLLIRNYWLGTFSLVSLQIAVGILLIYGLFFFSLLYLGECGLRYFEKRIPHSRVLHILLFILVYSSMWTIFDWVQTQGFTAYPWTLMPHSQWRNLPLIQISSVTGIWGIGQLVYLINGLIAAFFYFSTQHRKSWRRVAAVVIIFVILIHGAGVAVLLSQKAPKAVVRAFVELTDENEIITHYRYTSAPPDGFARIALVQQNSDPHKSHYEKVLDTLMLLSDGIKEAAVEPDLVVWSETAFVPNIARWGGGDQDPSLRLVKVVQRMLDYQKNMGAWLLTGNNNYEMSFNDDGSERERESYNAAILFSPEGERVDSYHKIKLVPFTEYFPYGDQFPRIHALLQDFDVHFWKPGDRRTVFYHPQMTFSTPICFEDTFPDEVRRFVLAGSEVILSISNDYWSLTEVAAKQHFAGSLFRAVENRRYLLRSTASGMTAVVDPYGRVVLELPSYVAAATAVDIPVGQSWRAPLYTRFGDYYLLLPLLFLLVWGIYIMSQHTKGDLYLSTSLRPRSIRPRRFKARVRG